jgi:uncharacterized protein YndB with AHSA1/START domain
MLERPDPACLVIADISGYTSYLAGVELDHAQDILADLTDVVVRTLRPTFRLAKLEGDAAFAYVIAAELDGSALQDTIEHCYFAFRRRLRDIGQASQCECNACILIPRLDLKFVVHHGLVARQRMAGREELVGRDVIVVHRLLKNTVQQELGSGAYALYTEECVRAMGLADPAAAGLQPHSETYEIVGEIRGWVRDLEAAWLDEESRSQTKVGADESVWSTTYTLPIPPEVAWEWITSPVRRQTWQPGLTGFDEAVAGGRRGVGTTNHCIHGKDAVVEEVLAWRPPELLTVRMQVPFPGVPKFILSDILEAAPDGVGTTVTVRVGRPTNAKDRAKVEQGMPMLAGAYEAGIAPLRAAIDADLRAQAAAAATQVPEPDLPEPTRRNLSEPVAAAGGTVDSRAARSSG